MVVELLSALLGGGTGIIGSIASEAVGFFKRRQEHEHRMEEREFELKMMDKEAAIAESQHALELEKVTTQKEWEAFSASQQPMERWSKGDHFMMPWVDVIRGLTRPTLTIATQLLLAGIYFTVARENADMSAAIIQSVIYMANTSFFWWFGQRQIQKVGRAIAR